MSDASRRVGSGQQVNFTLDPHWRLVLRLAAEAEGVSVPDLIRPVVMRYLRGRMRNADLQEAVGRIEQIKQSRRSVPDNITPIPKTRPARSTAEGRRSQSPQGD
jgi:hypothetical protein